MWAHRVRECCHFLTRSVVTDPRCLLLQMDNHQHHVPALLYALFILFNKDLTRTGLSDYGLKIQDIVPRGIYRSALQPYAAMWGIFWYVSHSFVTMQVMDVAANQGGVLHPRLWYLRVLPLQRIIVHIIL